jgi:short subunit dehydrogenase-like uncharacterized protein
MDLRRGTIMHEGGMPGARILLAGGYGLVGAQVATLAAKYHPQAELLIGGRNPAKGEALAAALGRAKSVLVDTHAHSPLVGVDGRIDAVLGLVHDDSDFVLNACIARGIPYADITRGPAAAMRAYASLSLGPALTAPVLFSSNWMAGVPAILAMHMALGFAKVEAIELSLLFYGADRVGPDSSDASGALAEPFAARIGGTWRNVPSMSDGRRVRFPSGLARKVYRMNMADVVTLAQASGADDVAVRLGLDSPATLAAMRLALRFGLWPLMARLSGQPGQNPGKGARHEMVIEVRGVTANGQAGIRRASVLDSRGQAHLTAIGALAALEAIAGLGRPALRPGPALPETAPDGARLLALLQGEGVEVRFDPS